ncbi:hypothetical protein E2562_015009, partial [Oryza meyeriana var. granulata]
ECSCPAWLYTGDRDATQTHVVGNQNKGWEELVMMLRVVVGAGDITANSLPREDLALCNHPGRVALQETLPRCNAKEI